jgi:hypothetical protein
VIEPEIGHYLLKLVLAVYGPDKLLLDQLDEYLLRPAEDGRGIRLFRALLGDIDLRVIDVSLGSCHSQGWQRRESGFDFGVVDLLGRELLLYESLDACPFHSFEVAGGRPKSDSIQQVKDPVIVRESSQSPLCHYCWQKFFGNVRCRRMFRSRGEGKIDKQERRRQGNRSETDAGKFLFLFFCQARGQFFAYCLVLCFDLSLELGRIGLCLGSPPEHQDCRRPALENVSKLCCLLIVQRQCVASSIDELIKPELLLGLLS